MANVGDGDGGETIWDHLKSFPDDYKTIFRTAMPPQYVFRPKGNFLEMVHTNIVSSAACQRFIRTYLFSLVLISFYKRFET